jgi:outer membrane protein
MKIPLVLFFLATLASFTYVGALPASDSGGPVQNQEIRTLTVQEAVRMTLARSPEVLLAEARADRAREAVRENRSLNLPNVYTGTGLAYNNGYPLSMEGAAPSIFQVSASQPLLSRKYPNLIREAEESNKASRFGVDNARNDLASRTALVYYQLYQARKIVDIASGMRDLALKQQEQMNTLLAAGRARPFEVTLARNAARSAEQQVLVAQEQAKLSEMELRELTGLSDMVSINTVEPRIENPIFGLQGRMLYQQALESAPEILQAEANVRAKEFHAKAEQGEYLPQADIIGQYALFSKANNYEDYFNRFSRNNFIIGLSVQVPIFNGSRTSSRVAQSRQEVSEARYRMESLKSGLKLTIERGMSALRIARGESGLARSNVEAAREMNQVNEALLEEGRISPKEMQDSRSLLHQKELALLLADQILFQRKLELLRAVGSITLALQ